jgi:hypothetical protein
MYFAILHTLLYFITVDGDASLIQSFALIMNDVGLGV